jgi:hypothetical protein
MKLSCLIFKTPLSGSGKLVHGLLSLLFLIGVHFAYGQTIHTVDNRNESGAQFNTLQAAIDAAVAGDIIYVHPSPTTYGNITIKKTLTLVGLGHNPNNANGERAFLGNISFNGTADASNTTITGLEFGSVSSYNCANCDGIKLINNRIKDVIAGWASGNSDNWVIEGCFIFSTSYFWPSISPAATDSNWQIRNNFIYRFYLNYLSNTTILTNNIIAHNGGNVLFFQYADAPMVANNIFLFTGAATEVGLDANSTVSFNNCMTYSYSGQTISALSGAGNLDNTDPLFTNVPVNNVTDFYNNDYSLTAGSPGKNGGTDATDIGLFGNNFAFDNNGRPELMPYPISMIINNSVVQPGQDLNVDFSAAIKQ